MSENPSLEPGEFLERKLISDYGQFFYYESQPRAADGIYFWGSFQGNSGLWTGGRWLVPTSLLTKASTSMDLGTAYIYFCITSPLRNAGLVDRTDLQSVTFPLCC